MITGSKSIKRLRHQRLPKSAVILTCLVVWLALSAPRPLVARFGTATGVRTQPDHGTALQGVAPSTSKIKFRLVRISDGRLNDGTRWSIFDLEVSDGHSVYKQNFTFSSIEGANQRFRKYIKAAEKVIRRNPEMDEKGEVVGQRALALFSEKQNETVKPKYIVFWTSGELFFEIAGEHVEDVVALERRLKQEPLTDILKE